MENDNTVIISYMIMKSSSKYHNILKRSKTGAKKWNSVNYPKFTPKRSAEENGHYFNP